MASTPHAHAILVTRAFTATSNSQVVCRRRVRTVHLQLHSWIHGSQLRFRWLFQNWSNLFLNNLKIVSPIKALSCVVSFDYCSSLPCLNNGQCVTIAQTRSIVCICNASMSYGEFCQYLVAPSVYSTSNVTNIMAASVNSPVVFNQQVKPCLALSWQQANPQFCKHFNINKYLLVFIKTIFKQLVLLVIKWFRP